MKIFLDGKEIDVNVSDVFSLLKELRINPETVVVSKNNHKPYATIN